MTQRPASKIWEKGNWNLRCVRIFHETRDVKTFHFVDADQGETQTLFRHKPGQFIVLRLRSDAHALNRSYTVASPPSRPETLQLTIKRDPNGLVSRYMHDHLKVGDVLPVSGPVGEFNSVDINSRRSLLLLSGGSGITPVMSILRYIYDSADTETDVIFLHSSRTPADIIFRNELSTMAAARDNLKIGFICDADAEDGMRSGLFSFALLNEMAPDFLERTVLTCGPKPYMQAIKDMLFMSGFDMKQYHEESFSEASNRRHPENATPDTVGPQTGKGRLPDTIGEAESKLPASDPPIVDSSAAGEQVVNFRISGKSENYKAGETLLAIASRAGIAVPTSCQIGLCGTCMLKILRGEVEMDEDEGLEDEFRAEGYRLSCCGHPKGTLDVEF
ncbi:MAG: hybrid-cluster NAD(P)-dependent oxidoreductase [Rhodobacterales bacterium]|nr:hybrid-cluster NAD(P)-dependent oxidoreductase [Rhodobacterales bacterium]